MSGETPTEEQWREILAEPGFVSEKMLDILDLIYSRPGHRAASGWLGKRMGYESSNTSITPNRIVGALGEKLKNRHALDSILRSDGTPQPWAHVFDGERGEDAYDWIMRPELVRAFEGMNRDADHLHSGEVDPRDAGDYPEDAGDYPEGALKRVMVNSYERNGRARRACIDHHGPTCTVCAFDFSVTYGKHGEGFIHVHHLDPVSASKGTRYHVDPVEDLRPVCPNCHAMLHRGDGVLSIEGLKDLIDQHRNTGGA